MSSFIAQLSERMTAKRKLLESCEKVLASEPGESGYASAENLMKQVYTQDLLFLAAYKQLLESEGVSSLEEIPKARLEPMKAIQEEIKTVLSLQQRIQEDFDAAKLKAEENRRLKQNASRIKNAYAKKMPEK
ncbi:MAG: hypothetical protein PWQ12_916 [Clostridiales bacterium]|nr:hypothetical protein [Clostridiales bacterium]